MPCLICTPRVQAVVEAKIMIKAKKKKQQQLRGQEEEEEEIEEQEEVEEAEEAKNISSCFICRRNHSRISGKAS